METKRNLISVILTAAILLLTATPAQPATEDEIEASVQAGIEWLVDQQDPGTGKWQDVPLTGFVLIKLQDRAYELGKDPFQMDPEADDYYEYAANVIAGWQYLFTPSVSPGPVGAYAQKQTIGVQTHGDPDSNGNGYGICFQNSGYNTGICLMALAATRAPNRANDGGLDYDGDGNADTYGQIAQDVVDWLAFAQVDAGNQEGAWGYGPNGGGDNSVSGYAVLGLGAAEGFGYPAQQWVIDELSVFINNVQDPVDGDTHDGGSWYRAKVQHWVNLLKTGNLIFEMTFYGDSLGVTRFDNAMDYIERHWQDANLDPGFRGDAGIDDDGDTLIDEDPHNWYDDDGDGLIDEDMGLSNHYQAMYCLMKGLEYSGIDLLDLDGDNVPEHDWFQELATILLGDQKLNGSWPSSPCYVWPDGRPGTMSGEILSTVWALLTLEKITPPPPEIPVFVDIKPQSCPNPLNKSAKGVLPVAVLGTLEFDVTQIDPATVGLSREGVEEVVSALRWAYEDVAEPFEGELCDCHTLGPDGYLDLTLKFDTQELVEKLKLCEVPDWETIPLTLTGNLLDEQSDEPSTPIRGADCVRIQDSKGPKK